MRYCIISKIQIYNKRNNPIDEVFIYNVQVLDNVDLPLMKLC